MKKTFSKFVVLFFAVSLMASAAFAEGNASTGQGTSADATCHANDRPGATAPAAPGAAAPSTPQAGTANVTPAAPPAQ